MAARFAGYKGTPVEGLTHLEWLTDSKTKVGTDLWARADDCAWLGEMTVLYAVTVDHPSNI